MVTRGGVVPPAERAETQQLVGELVREARSDLGLAGVDEPTPSEVAAMIFNDFDSDARTLPATLGCGLGSVHGMRNMRARRS